MPCAEKLVADAVGLCPVLLKRMKARRRRYGIDTAASTSTCRLHFREIETDQRRNGGKLISRGTCGRKIMISIWKA
jgi:hypothetical protein